MNTIQLKQQGKKIYFITGLTEDQANEIIANKNYASVLEDISKKLSIECKNIELIGSTNEATFGVIGRYVAYLKGYSPSLSNPDKRIQFRDYSQSEKQQLKNAWLVSICEDERMSAKTLLTQIKEPFLCIWYKENS